MVTSSLYEICVVREACKVLVTSVNVKYGVRSWLLRAALGVWSL